MICKVQVPLTAAYGSERFDLAMPSFQHRMRTPPLMLALFSNSLAGVCESSRPCPCRRRKEGMGGTGHGWYRITAAGQRSG
jgi:hypothetical protein